MPEPSQIALTGASPIEPRQNALLDVAVAAEAFHRLEDEAGRVLADPVFRRRCHDPRVGGFAGDRRPHGRARAPAASPQRRALRPRAPCRPAPRASSAGRKAASEHIAMAAMMHGLRQRHAHQAGRSDGAIEPRQLHHLQNGADAGALLADAPGKSVGEFDFARRIGAVAKLVLEALKAQRVDRAVRPKARQQRNRSSPGRLRQHQKCIAHRRR